MSTAIRLSRGGSKKRPYYRIIVADSRSPRDGRFIERIGSYNPLLAKDNPERVKLDVERAKHWLSVGAQPSDNVRVLIKKYGAEGLSGLYRSKKTPSLLPEGVDETEETLRRELIKTRIELERLKKGYIRIPREDGTPGEFVPVSEKSTRSSRRSRRSSL